LAAFERNGNFRSLLCFGIGLLRHHLALNDRARAQGARRTLPGQHKLRQNRVSDFDFAGVQALEEFGLYRYEGLREEYVRGKPAWSEQTKNE
jgi:hypothetical protein